MNAVDIVLGLLAGVVSCVTPEALLLFPLLLAAASAEDRISIVAISIGLGSSLVLTGTFAASLAATFGIGAIWLRRIACAALLLQGLALMSVSLVERFPRLTGGPDRVFATRGPLHPGAAFRMVLLALLVGANWVPLVGPTLGKASLMAADARDAGLAFAILFAFGVGAAAPWIVLGRILRAVLRPVPGVGVSGMAGKRILGAALVIVALPGITGLDAMLAHWLGAMLPAWTRKLATTF